MDVVLYFVCDRKMINVNIVLGERIVVVFIRGWFCICVGFDFFEDIFVF